MSETVFREIASVPRSDVTKFVLSLVLGVGGPPRVSLRLFRREASGVFRPTGAGLTFERRDLPRLIEGMERALDVVDAEIGADDGR